MNILVLNASPKGKASATLHTALYLEALHPEHTFEFLPVGVRIKRYEKDFAPARAALERADLVLFCYECGGAPLRELLTQLQVDYGYNHTDALLVLKDILARVWKGQM